MKRYFVPVCLAGLFFPQLAHAADAVTTSSVPAAAQAATEASEPEFDFELAAGPALAGAEPSEERRAVLNVYPDITLDLLAPGDANSAFRSGDLDLLVSSRSWGRWSGLAEIVLEGGEHGVLVDLERVTLGYDASEWLRIDAGRMHNPIVRWNVTYHHGAYLQTPIERPAMARWEDEPGAWPAHFMGVMATGRLEETLGLQYVAGVANGRGDELTEIQTVADRNPSKAFVAGLGVAPEAVRGLTFFATGYRDRIASPGVAMDESDYTLSLAFRRSGTEVLAEWGEMFHAPVGAGITYSTLGWYALVSQALPNPLQSVRPYLMVDRLAPASTEPFLEGMPAVRAGVAGLRWDAHEGIAVKAEYRRESPGGSDWTDTVRTQLAGSF